MLSRKSLRKLVVDVKVIPGEEVALQHQLLVCEMIIDKPPQIKRKFTPHPKEWKLRDLQTCSRFQEVFKAHVPAVETEAATTTEEIWAKLKIVRICADSPEPSLLHDMMSQNLVH